MNYLDSRIARAMRDAGHDRVFVISFRQKFSRTRAAEPSKSHTRVIILHSRLDRPGAHGALTGESAVNYYQFRHRRLFIIDPVIHARRVWERAALLYIRYIYTLIGYSTVQSRHSFLRRAIAKRSLFPSRDFVTLDFSKYKECANNTRNYHDFTREILIASRKERAAFSLIPLLYI